MCHRSYAQSGSNPTVRTGQAGAVPAGATGIDLVTTQPDSALFRAVSGFLETQEYVIEQTDEQKYALSTELNEGVEPSMRILVSVESGTAHFTAEGRPSDWADTDQPFTNEGETKAGFLALNRLVDQFARSFANATIEYQTP
ncbi:hypothetical protein HH216_07005 [Spirosoma rhododendri]|uniref:Uncharacterized protein n=1 Tax=Spirosoma rhododendri TaxID=2728024 RepID=A0A7L5DV93_9BACT|nr:hypothetical protein HH216_07005 [Spirosoma rhododendri]